MEVHKSVCVKYQNLPTPPRYDKLFDEAMAILDEEDTSTLELRGRVIFLSDTDKVIEVKRILQAVQSGGLPHTAALIAIGMVVNPPLVTGADHQWATKLIEEHPERGVSKGGRLEY